MSYHISEEHLKQLKAFVEVCKSQPGILQDPKLNFFKDYLVSLGVTLPSATFGAKSFAAEESKQPAGNAPEASTSEEESEPESDVELDIGEVMEPDVVTSQEMGDPEKVPTEEECDQSDEKRTAAVQAFSQQKFDEAILLYTDAIKLNPQSALLFAKRGQVYLKLRKPNACIQDCARALELNCDSAAAYKFRGRAYGLLGKFEEASVDLCESLKIDYDDQTNEWLSEVKPNAEKLRQHKLAQRRKREEKQHRDRIRRARKAKEARAKAAKEATTDNKSAPGGFTGVPPGFSADKLQDLLFDPEIMSVFQDPEVAAAFQDVSQNPANFAKYQNNPKIANVIGKLQNKFAKSGGPQFPDGMPDFTTPPKPNPENDDVGLD